MITAEAPASTSRCPRCGAVVADEQDWCLECGDEITPALEAPRRRRWWAVLAPLALLGAAAAGVITLSGPGERPAAGGAGETSTATRPSSTSQASASPAPGPSGPSPRAPAWPAGQESYTVVLHSTPDLTAAESRARDLVARGADAGVLRSDEFEGFPPGRWVVWRGRYQRLAKAQEALGLLRRSGRSGEIKYVRSRAAPPARTAPPASQPPSPTD